MYVRRIKSRNLFQLSCHHLKSSLRGISQSHGDHRVQSNLIRKFNTVPLPLSNHAPLGTFRSWRCYSSERENGNSSDFEKEKGGKEGEIPDSTNASLGGQVKKEHSPFITRRDMFKNEFLRRVIPWEKITDSWENFPYYIDEHTKTVMVECAASHFKHRKFATSYGSRLSSSSGRILLQSIPGTELYREKFISAFAHDLQVPLLVLNSGVLAPYNFGQGCAAESEAEDEGGDTDDECTSESETEGENDASNEDASESDENENVDVHVSAKAIKKLVPCNLEEFAKIVSEEIKDASTSAQSDAVDSVQDPKQPLKKGDRVKYVGASGNIQADNRPLSNGQRGEVLEVKGDQVAVILDNTEDITKEGDKDKNVRQDAKPSVYWFDIQDIVHDVDSQTEDWYIALEALREVLSSPEPLIIYFPDSTTWLSRAVPKSYRKEFIQKLEKMFDEVEGPVVLICGQTIVETGTKEKEKFTLVLHQLGRLARLPVPLKRLTEGLTVASKSDNDISKLFTNTYFLRPPKEEELLQTFNKQIEEDRRIIILRNNLAELHEVLEENGLSCMGLLDVKTDGLFLTKEKAEKVVGWAKNHYLSSSKLLTIKGDRLNIPCESLDIAISRLREREAIYMKPLLNLKSLAKDEYESNFISAVVPPDEVGVKFDDIGALEDVKKTLHELVTLPMRRPELFAHGNLLRPCKGILLFGPPGTGKTLLAKALATEAGANFISITGSTLTSKWFGDAEKLTKALFSFASRLAPVIIFVDEVDSLLGARGGAFEHEATRRMRNEFMAAWDGLRSKDSQRILILGATNRPFDLDDAVIRRLPRRIYVDLPDAENRTKILRILLSKENLDQGFIYNELARATEGYSGSDLKNLCIAAAYRPVQELIESEKKGEGSGTSILRPLNLEDFLQAKAKVGASVAYDAASMNELRKWNEMYGEDGSRRKAPFGFGN